MAQIRCELETLLPQLAAFVAEQWRSRHDDEWMNMQTWISGISAALYFVSNEAFEGIVQELDFLEQICAARHKLARPVVHVSEAHHRKVHSA